MSVNVHIVFHSLYGHVYRLAEAIAQGAREVPGANVELFQVAETLPHEVLEKMGAIEARKTFAHVPVADPKRLSEADVVFLGTGTRYGSASAQLQAFFDATGSLWAKGALVGKVGSLFASTGTQHGGQESTLLSMQTFLLHHGMVFVGVPYAAQGLSMIDEVSGGTPYGATTIAGPRGDRLLTENESAIARFQGKHATEIAAKLVAK